MSGYPEDFSEAAGAEGRTIHLDKPLSKSALDDAVREAIGD